MASTLQVVKLRSSLLHLPNQPPTTEQRNYEVHQTLTSTRMQKYEPCSIVETTKLDKMNPLPRVLLRRSLVATTATALAVGVWSDHPKIANAARIKAAPAKEKRPEDDKNLSALDAKVLANFRRKEAMKGAVAALKEKAKTAR
ncbi:hypothetical protein O6H91_04G013400 [Diphasiastrum complanatum]|uniref:Uncharacterized protein n=1 Tax=Diphasiastrum complanatum TaxID=34168 RepID=A0ACC2DUF0_DIPCM|nr:hypothetical protein O6H91_04G013400 [Diphasiastrum complanatum]